MLYTRFDSPLCAIILAGDRSGLAHLHLDTGKGSRAFSIDPDWKRDDAFFSPFREQIAEYFQGRRQAFDLVLNPQGTAFQKRVWTALREIPFGETRSYGELAKTLGMPHGARAVGRANGTNPIPLIIPCHRVISSHGQLTGFAHGLEAKQFLLDLEGV